MGAGPTHTGGATMRRWMLAVGTLFVALGTGLLPWFNLARTNLIGLDSLYAGGDLTTTDAAYAYVLDWAGVFGLSLLVLGVVLLVVARDPVRHRTFAHLVIWHELGVGVVGDAWFIGRAHTPPVADAVYAGFIVLHLLVAASGVRALRRTPLPVAATPTAMPDASGAT